VISYDDEQVTMALMRLAVNYGDVDKTAEELINDEFQVPAETLRMWKLRDYTEEYRRLVELHNLELEQEMIALARQNARDASEAVHQLIEKVRDKIGGMDGKDAAIAARNLADVKAKSVDKMITLSNRPPRDPEPENLEELVRSMESSGIVRVRPRTPESAEDPSDGPGSDDDDEPGV
jgi:hypothetical protein